VYRANFAEDLDISSPATISACLTAAGADSATVLDEAGFTDSKPRLRLQTEEATELGIFGAPLFLVGGELF
jgi:2-hydroxychromene-2-carboxylate isomerase